MAVAFVAGTAVLVLLASLAAGDWADGDDGVDRMYGDLPGMPVALPSSASPRDCAALCQKEERCVAWAYCKPRCGGLGDPQCYLKASVMLQSANPCRVSGVKNAELLPPAFRPFPVGAVQPLGWLKRQLELQAEGLSGHLPRFWADVMNSSWVGGTADFGLHERAPYWLNGFVPLAYQLQDPLLISYVHKYVDYALMHQSAGGWLGPDDITDGNCYWSKFPMLLALVQYYEADSSDARVVPAIMKFLQVVQKRMFTLPLGNTWSGARWQDLVLTVHWMLDFHASGQEQMLWDLAELLHQQGFDWNGWFGGSSFPTKPVESTTLFTHGVNNGQAIKSAGVWYRQSHNQSDWKSSYIRMQRLDQYHGQATGMFACDEHLAGKMPSRGTELCTVVESMFSYETLFGIQGDPVFAERVELIAYNALPATITPDMWAHQYLQQINEMNAIHSDDHVWTHDGPDSTLYGLAPNYGCCTANFNQGWPKFVEHIVMATTDGLHLVVAMYAPVEVRFGSNSLTITTDYPFSDTVEIEAALGSVPKGMTLSFRIPSWADGATVQVNALKPQEATPGSLFKVSVSDSHMTFVLHFPMSIKVQRRYNNAASVYRGPLLYGLEIMENFKELRSYAFESKDYQVTPGSPWNYTLLLRDDSHPELDLSFVSTGVEIGVPPFSLKGAPGMILGKGDSWIPGRRLIMPLPHPQPRPPPPHTPSSPSPSSPLVPQTFASQNCQQL